MDLYSLEALQKMKLIEKIFKMCVFMSVQKEKECGKVKLKIMTGGCIILNGQYESITLQGSKDCQEDPHDKEWKFVGPKKKRLHQESLQKVNTANPVEPRKRPFPS